MADPTSRLRIWEGPAPSRDRPFPRVPPPTLAEQLAAQEALRPGAAAREGAEPFTLQWYLDVEHARHGRQGRWIPKLLEFTRHGGEKLLGLGSGLGTDWVQYARHGASVLACGPSAEQLALVRRNFELRGLRASFLHASPADLPLESASVDVACVTGLLHEADDPRAVVDEVYRVLKPGGKVLALTPARYDIDFWCRRVVPWHQWLRRRPALAAPADALAFSARGLRRLFGRFIEPRVHKRHLRRSEVPHLWRWLPLPALERLFGRLLVFKGFKPVSAAKAEPLAA